jgi:hypothetical protein
VSLVQDGRFTAGGGATEIEMARQIAAWGETHPGLEQYSISRSPFLYSELRIRHAGSGAFLTRDPKSQIVFFRIPDLKSRIPNPYIFLGKKYYFSFFSLFKTKIIFHFMVIVANFLPHLVLTLDPRSGMRDG